MSVKSKICEILLYPESSELACDFKKLEELCKLQSIEYCFILHDKCKKEGTNELKKSHVHVYLKFANQRHFTEISKVFGCSENAVSKSHGSYDDCILYATHKNAPEKYQYNDDEVVANFDYTSRCEKILANKTKKQKKAYILQKIADGEYTERNIVEKITLHDYVENERYIKSAFDFKRQELSKNCSREIQVIYIQGSSGVGKTTFAKELCINSGYDDVYVSSSGSDFLSDYKSERAIILDDLRSDTMTLSEFLKMTDKHTQSAVKSRYHNKILSAELIIVTSIKQMIDFYSDFQHTRLEEPKQIFRRCSTYIEMTEKFIKYSFYNDEMQSYEIGGIYENHIFKKYVSGKEKNVASKMKDFSSRFKVSVITCENEKLNEKNK